MNNAIGDALATEWRHIRHPRVHGLPYDQADAQHDQTSTQETSMSKLDAARQAITAIADNPLIDAIAEAGIGKWMHPDEIAAVVALWREVEYGRQQASAAAPPTLTQQLADSLTPKQL